MIWNSETTQNQNIYNHNYQTEATIFLATKHEKTMACSYLNFYKHFLHFKLLANNTTKNEIIHLNSWHHSNKKQKNSLRILVVLLIFLLELEISGMALQRIHQNSKKWEFLWRMAYWKWLWGCFWPIYVVIKYGFNASEAVQKISTRHWSVVDQLIKTVNFIVTLMKKHI